MLLPHKEQSEIFGRRSPMSGNERRQFGKTTGVKESRDSSHCQDRAKLLPSSKSEMTLSVGNGLRDENLVTRLENRLSDSIFGVNRPKKMHGMLNGMH